MPVFYLSKGSLQPDTKTQSVKQKELGCVFGVMHDKKKLSVRANSHLNKPTIILCSQHRLGLNSPVTSNPYSFGGGRSFPRQFKSKCKTRSSSAWLLVNPTTTARNHMSSWDCALWFLCFQIQNLNQWNRHHSIHPTCLSGTKWHSKTKNWMETVWWRKRRKCSSSAWPWTLFFPLPVTVSPAHCTSAPHKTMGTDNPSFQPVTPGLSCLLLPGVGGEGGFSQSTIQEQPTYWGDPGSPTNSQAMATARGSGPQRPRHTSDIWIPWSQWIGLACTSWRPIILPQGPPTSTIYPPSGVPTPSDDKDAQSLPWAVVKPLHISPEALMNVKVLCSLNEWTNSNK